MQDRQREISLLKNQNTLLAERLRQAEATISKLVRAPQTARVKQRSQDYTSNTLKRFREQLGSKHEIQPSKFSEHSRTAVQRAISP